MPEALPRIDTTVLARARNGDREACAEIVSVLRRPALRLATVVGGDPTEAEDIVQEAFVRVLRSIGTVRSADTLPAWVMRIVANQAKNARRGGWRRDRRHRREASTTLTVAAGVEDRALDALAADQLLGALRRMPDDDRRVLGCRYLAGMSEAETAEVLGVAVGTVKSRTARSLQRLRGELEREEGR